MRLPAKLRLTGLEANAAFCLTLFPGQMCVCVCESWFHAHVERQASNVTPMKHNVAPFFLVEPVLSGVVLGWIELEHSSKKPDFNCEMELGGNYFNHPLNY